MELEGSPVVAPPLASGDVRHPGVGPDAEIGAAYWRGDVALELWVDADVHPVRIGMAGRLDATTAANLDEVVRELLAAGKRDFELSTDGLRVVDASAVGALAGIERLVRGSGGSLRRVGPSSGPFPRSTKGVPPPPARR